MVGFIILAGFLLSGCVVLVAPLVILSGYLQYTHTLRNVGGALHVGQSTYGDLCLHLGIATSLRNAPFPPTYSLLPGALRLIVPKGMSFFDDKTR